MESSILTFIFHWVLKLGSIEQGYTFVVVVVVFGTHLFQFSFSFLFLFFFLLPANTSEQLQQCNVYGTLISFYHAPI